MPIEPIVNYASDLNPAWPAGGDPKSDGDNHIRNLKEVARNMIVGFAGSLIVTGTDGGIVNAYTLTPTTPLKEYSPRMIARFAPTAANTGGVTINISGLGIKAVTAVDGSPLKADDLAAGRIVDAIYDGTQFRLMTVTKNYVDQIVTSGIVPGVNVAANAGKFFTTDGSTGLWATIDTTPEPGSATKDKGNSGITAQIVNYGEGEGQTITATGAFNLSASGFPANRIAGVLLKAVNWGAYLSQITSTGITWMKADNSKASTFATAGIVLPASGEGFIVVFSYGDGVIYGKAA